MCDGFRHIFYAAWMAERDALVGSVPFRIGVMAADFGGFGSSWRDRVDSNSSRRELQRERPGETEDAGFGGGVGGAGLAAAVGDVGRDIDNRAGLLIFHHHGYGAAAKKR